MLLVVTVGIPSTTRFLALLNNAGHAPIFGLLALIALRLVGSRRTGAFEPQAMDFLVAFELTVLLGAAVEWMQWLTGRGASLVDILMDAAGAAAALAIAGVVQHRRESLRLRVALIGLAVIAIAVVLAPLVEAAIAYQQRNANFPVLARFEQRLDLYFIRAAGVEIERAELPRTASQGERAPALRLRFTRSDTPGLRVEEPFPDWRGYERLEVELENPGPRPLQLMIRVHDRAHDQRHADRFNLPFTLAGGSRELLSIPLQAIEQAPDRRTMDMARIAGIVIFARDRPAPVGAEFFLGEIRLR